MAALVIAVWPTEVSPDVAPAGVDVPGCGWGVILDVHPDLADRPDFAQQCAEVVGDARRDVAVLIALGAVAAVAGSLTGRLSARSSASGG